MPSLRPVSSSITSLTDKQLSEQLHMHGVTSGPILPSTRKVYERKLFQLETGQTAAPSSGYEPVSDDEEEEELMDEDSVDEEVTFQHSQPRQRTTKTTRTEVWSLRKPSPRKPLHPTGMAHSSTSAEGPDPVPRSQSQSRTHAPQWLGPRWTPLVTFDLPPCKSAGAPAAQPVTYDAKLQSVLQLIQEFDEDRLVIVRNAVQRRLDNVCHHGHLPY